MITLHYASGSPYAWRAWLALEHKEIPYELRTLSFRDGDLTKPDYVALNPRGRVPTLVDDGFAIRESAAIVEYLDQAYPVAGKPLFPRDARGAATVRRMIREIDSDFGACERALVEQILRRPAADRDAAAIADARARVLAELRFWERELEGKEYLAGELGAADYALYPLVALTLRMEKLHAPLDLARDLPPNVVAWMKRIQALPQHEKTYPPHWR